MLPSLNHFLQIEHGGGLKKGLWYMTLKEIFPLIFDDEWLRSPIKNSMMYLQFGCFFSPGENRLIWKTIKGSKF